MEQADKELLKRYKEGLCSEEENAIVESWYLSWDYEQNAPTPSQIDQAHGEVWALLPGEHQNAKRTIQYWKLSVAASLLLILGFTSYFYFSDNRNAKHTVGKISPGTIGATLTLVNGEKIHLPASSNGEMISNYGSSYQISTARGETYQLLLPDSSRVWLNAASSLTNKAGFDKNGQRTFRLEGEAYFEVKKDKLHPFVVETKDQKVKVLGTHFNIKAYTDEKVTKTTLIEGSVMVNTGKDSIILHPNQQTSVLNGKLDVYNINTHDATAWKNGDFVFNYETIESMMNMIGRWYKVRVVYSDGNQAIRDSKERFMGRVSRDRELKDILSIIELLRIIRFDLQEDKIIVYYGSH